MGKRSRFGTFSRERERERVFNLRLCQAEVDQSVNSFRRIRWTLGSQHNLESLARRDKLDLSLQIFSRPPEEQSHLCWPLDRVRSWRISFAPHHRFNGSNVYDLGSRIVGWFSNTWLPSYVHNWRALAESLRCKRQCQSWRQLPAVQYQVRWFLITLDLAINSI